MDCLLEALQSGAAFRDRRKRAPRPRGKPLKYRFITSTLLVFSDKILLIQCLCSQIAFLFGFETIKGFCILLASLIIFLYKKTQDIGNLLNE